MIKPGKLQFYSETGTEGGYYAMQDAEYIEYTTPNYGVLKGRTVYEPNDTFRSGIVEKSYKEDGSPFESASQGDVSFLDIAWQDGDTDTARLSDTVKIESWSHDGVLYLKNGDRLTIFEKVIGSIALWSGKVLFEKQDSYANGSYSPHGLASHQKPLNLGSVSEDTWSNWFFEKCWANLERPNF